MDATLTASTPGSVVFAPAAAQRRAEGHRELVP
ncbi:hypothetical protein QFZ58_000086 [Streptomyces sp. B1I3]|nr:hypothetical protein [Streptomyces sp. B1I3]